MSRSITFAEAMTALIALLILPIFPAFAQFTGGGAQATNWVVELMTPIIPLGCVVVALLAFAGRINWLWFASACVGTILFFGRDQVVSMIRGWFGV